MAKKTIQNVTNFDPTKTEAAIIEALLNPANRLKTVTDLCNTVGCNRMAYYRAFDKPEFVKYLNEQSMLMVKGVVIPVLHAFQREAVRGSFQHGKAILEMAGLYVEKKEVKVEHPERELTDVQLMERIKTLNEKLGIVKPQKS